MGGSAYAIGKSLNALRVAGLPASDAVAASSPPSVPSISTSALPINANDPARVNKSEPCRSGVIGSEPVATLRENTRETSGVAYPSL